MLESYVAEPLRSDSSAPHWERVTTLGRPAAAEAPTSRRREVAVRRGGPRVHELDAEAGGQRARHDVDPHLHAGRRAGEIGVGPAAAVALLAGARAGGGQVGVGFEGGPRLPGAVVRPHGDLEVRGLGAGCCRPRPGDADRAEACGLDLTGEHGGRVRPVVSLVHAASASATAARP